MIFNPMRVTLLCLVCFVFYLSIADIFAQQNERPLLDLSDVPDLPYSLETDEDIITISSPVIKRQKVFVDLTGINDPAVRVIYQTLLKNNINWSGVFDYHENPLIADFKLNVYNGLFSDFNADFTTQADQVIYTDKLTYYSDSGRKTEYSVISLINNIVKKLTQLDTPLGKAILYTEKKIGSPSKIIRLSDTHNYVNKVLVDNDNLNFYPRWNHTGSKFSFISLTPRGYTLRIYNFADASIKESGIYESSMSGGSWSPDDTAIAVTISRAGNSDIYTVSSETGKIIDRITRLSTIETSASFSPDGNTMTLTSNKSGQPQIYRLGKNTTILKRLTFAGKYNTEPHWSPLGDKFLYGTIIGGSMEIMLYNLISSEVLRVTRSRESSEQARWSPDARQIIFTKKFNANSKIFMMNTDASHSRRLTSADDASIESDPDWSSFSIDTFTTDSF